MNGKLVGGAIVLSALVAGGAIYWLQEYAFYHDAAFKPGQEIVLTTLAGQPQSIPVSGLSGIDADSSPLRFRACFNSGIDLSTLTEGFQLYETPEPLIAPSWFDCFDAARIGEALETGEAVAFLGQADIFPAKTPAKPGDKPVVIDRVVAIFPDGTAYAWNQLSAETEH